MKNKKISILMAEYNTNTEDFRAAIKSVLDQTYSEFEFIIVDDRGNNDVEMIANEFQDNRIRIVKNDKNRGFVYSLNKGIGESRGEYIVRMDTDDLISENRIETLYNFISKNEYYDVVSSRALEFSGKERYGVIGKQGEKRRREVMRGDVPVHAASIIRKSALLEVGGYKEKYLRAEDLALWCDMLLAGKRLYMLNDVLYFYRVNKADYSKRTLKHRKGEITARLHYYPKLKAGPIEYMRIVKSIVAGILPTSMIQAYRNKFVVNKEDL